MPPLTPMTCTANVLKHPIKFKDYIPDCHPSLPEYRPEWICFSGFAVQSQTGVLLFYKNLSYENLIAL